MEKWTVILKTPEGLRYETIEADTAEWSEDGKLLEFLDMAVFDTILGFISKSREDMTRQTAKSEIQELFHALAGAKVASFAAESVMGHFKGVKASESGPGFGGLTAILSALRAWHPRLAELLADHLTRGLESKTQIDEMLMSVTKLVEGTLKQTLEEWTAAIVSATGAQTLLSLAENQGLFKKSAAILALFRWFFAEPRNTSHHEFADHPDVIVLLWLGCADTLLRGLDARKKERHVPFHITVEPRPTGPLDISVSLTSGPYTVPSPDAKVEGVLSWTLRQRDPRDQRDRVIKTFPLASAGSGVWTGSYDTRDMPLGSASFSVRGADSSGPFHASSGTVVNVNYGLCGNCGAPGKVRGVPCPSCGK